MTTAALLGRHKLSLMRGGTLGTPRGGHGGEVGFTRVHHECGFTRVRHECGFTRVRAFTLVCGVCVVCVWCACGAGISITGTVVDGTLTCSPRVWELSVRGKSVSSIVVAVGAGPAHVIDPRPTTTWDPRDGDGLGGQPAFVVSSGARGYSRSERARGAPCPHRRSAHDVHSRYRRHVY